jgi:hypothetical protein
MASLFDHAIHTDQKLEKHQRFWSGLEATLSAEQKAALAAGGRLRAIWDEAPAKPKPGPAPARMPYYSQVDSATDQGLRMCFSSSNAMLVEALRPGTLKGSNGDDQYLKVVQRYGDTTEVGAQLAAMRHFGLQARFSETANWEQLLKAQDDGELISLGFLHKGSVSRPTAGGHWLAVVRVAPDHLVVNDPYGEIDLVGGTYLNRQGERLRYSRRNFEPRWSVKQQGDRWVAAPNCGYAIFASV